MGQSRVVQALEQISFEKKTFPVKLILTNQLFERIPLVSETPISHNIDGTESSLSKQSFDDIASSMSASHCYSLRERDLFRLQASPLSFARSLEPNYMCQMPNIRAGQSSII